MAVTVIFQEPLDGVFPSKYNSASLPLMFFFTCNGNPWLPVTSIFVKLSLAEIALIFITFPTIPWLAGVTNTFELSNVRLVPFHRPIWTSANSGLGAARSPLPSGKAVPFKIWLCPAIFLSFGSVFWAFFPTVSLPFVVSSLGVFSSSGLWFVFTRLKLLFL